MRIKVVLFLALASGLLFLSVRRAARVRSTSAVYTASNQTAPLQPGPKVGLARAQASRQKAPAQAGEKVPPSQRALWDRPVTEPQFAAFKNWVGRYQQAAGAKARAALEDEGLTLARVRLTAMADLIQSNPERALELA